MKCEAVQNRLLATSDALHPGAELAAHVAGCAACLAMQARAAELDIYLTRLPAAPSSAAKRAAFLESILEMDPIIETKPRTLRTPSGHFRPWRAVRREHCAGLAAALLVALAGLAYFTRNKAQAPELAEKPRHELLKKEVRHVAKLATSDSAPQRMTVWAEWASDLKSETKDLYKVAPSDELSALARLFERAVQEGIVKQAKLLDKHMPAGDRRALFQDALARLTEVANDTTLWAQNAPPDAQQTLNKMAATARAAVSVLQPLEKGV